MIFPENSGDMTGISSGDTIPNQTANSGHVPGIPDRVPRELNSCENSCEARTVNVQVKFRALYIRVISAASVMVVCVCAPACAAAGFGPRDPFAEPQPFTLFKPPAPALFPPVQFRLNECIFSGFVTESGPPDIAPLFALVMAGSNQKMKGLVSGRLYHLDFMRDEYLFSIISYTLPLDVQLAALRRDIRRKRQAP
jgi:hypothetical protein